MRTYFVFLLIIVFNAEPTKSETEKGTIKMDKNNSKTWVVKTNLILVGSMQVQKKVKVATYSIRTSNNLMREFPVVLLTHSKNSSAHILPAGQDFYIETDTNFISGWIGSGEVIWANPYTSDSDGEKSCIMNFEEKIDGQNLLKQWMERPRTDFRKALPSNFFYVSPESSVMIIPRVDSITVNGKVLQFSFISPSGGARASIWIDIYTHRLVKTVQKKVPAK